MAMHLLVRGGDDPEAAVQTVRAVLESLADGVTAERVAPEALPDEPRKAVDPVSVAALVLAIPSTVLAGVDRADRIKKRRRAQTLVEAARRLRIEKKIETLVLTVDGPLPLDTMEPDQLLDLATTLTDAAES